MIQDRQYHLRTYKSCFVTSEAIDMVCSLNIIKKYPLFSPFTREKGVQLFQLFVDCGLIVHVVEKRKKFVDDYLFFKFTEENLDKDFIFKMVENFKDIKKVISLTSCLDKLDEFYFALTDPKKGVSIQDRNYRFRTYTSCFIGNELIDWICNYYFIKRPAGIFFGDLMRSLKAFEHVTGQHILEDDFYFYEVKPYTEFSTNCIKFVSQISALFNEPQKPIEITKDELLRHLTNTDIKTIIDKARIYLDESIISKKSIENLTYQDIKELFKKMNIIQIMKTLSDESQHRMNLTIQTVQRLSQFKKRELQKELILLFNELEKEKKQIYFESIYKIREIQTEAILSREEFSLQLQTKEEIIESSNHWMNVIKGIPKDILDFYAKIENKDNLIPDSIETMKIELKRLKEIMSTLPKYLIIQHLMRIRREGMIQMEKDKIRGILNSTKPLLSALLSPEYKNRQTVLKKILENEKFKSLVEKEIQPKRGSMNEEDIFNFLLQDHILTLMTLIMMRSQDLLDFTNLNYFLEFFGKKELNKEWKLVYTFFQEYHKLEEIKHPFSKSKLIEKLNDNERSAIVQMIQEQEYKNLSLFFGLPERDKLTQSQVNEIIHYIPREDFEVFTKVLNSKAYLNSPEKEQLLRESPKKDLLKMITLDTQRMSLRNDNYIKLMDLYFEKNSSYIPNEFIIVKELYQIIQNEYKENQQEYQLLDVKKASFIEESIKKKKKILLRYKGMILGVTDKYEYENNELFFKFEEINKEEIFSKRESKITSKGSADYYDLIVSGTIYEKAVLVYVDPKPEFMKLKGYGKFSNLKIKS